MSREKNFLKIKKPKNLNTIFGLPAESYTDHEFWKKECNTVLSDDWLFVGFVHELKNPGDVIPLSIAGKPIFLLKNTNNEITAFHNVCSHRCLKLINEKKNVGKIINCPYHAWSYDLNGKLKATPHVGGTNQHKPKGFNFLDHGLKPIKMHIWFDWIFINFNGKAKKFEEYAKPLFKRFEDIDLTKLKYAATLDFGIINTNWKFLIENFIEPYHVQFVHKTTTKQPLKDHYTIVDGVCLGSGVDVKEENKDSNTLSVSSRYLSLFPNFIIGTYVPNQIGVYLNVPISPGLTSQKRIIYTTAGNDMTKEEIEVQKKIWWSVHKEDHEICERLQEGRSSPASNQGGLLSPHWETSVRAFQKLIISSTMKGKKNVRRNK